MYVKQGDIFWGTSKEFLKEINDISNKTEYPSAQVLFSEGDPADAFYSLVKGQVKLSIGDAGQTVYSVSRAGEAFGWSSMVGHAAYTATAETVAPSTILVIDREELAEILERYPADSLVLFKQLAGTLGTRLLQSYRMLSGASRVAMPASHGTGQVQENVPAD